MSQIIKDLISNYTSGEALTANEAVYVSDGTGVDSGRTSGRVYKLEIGTVGRDKFAGFSKQTVGIAAEVKVITNGRLKGFSSLPLGSVVYADAVAGAYTTSKPSGKVQVLGSVESATVLIVNASLGSASSNLVDGALVGTTDSQTITNKTIVAANNTITTAASGNLTSTELDTALAELQTDIDTRSTVANLNDLSDTNTPTPADGEVLTYDNGTSKWVSSAPTGGGGSGVSSLDTFISESFETTVAADLLKGKDATFDNGGVLGGALADETVSMISGTSSLKYTTNGTVVLSNNDFFYLPAHTLDDKQKGQDVGINFFYNSSIADDLMEVVIYDDTNNVKLNSSLDLLKLSSTNQRYSSSVFIPLTCNAIKVGFHHVGASEVSKVLIVDDIELSTDPFVYKNLQDENVFSGRIFNNGTATIVSQSGDFIASVTRTALGEVDVVFKTDFFSLEPSIMVSVDDDAGNAVMIPIRNASATGFGIQTWIWNASKLDKPFNVIVQRQGSDYNHSSEHVITPMKSKPNSFAARIANNGTATVTSESSPFIQSVTVNGTGIVDVVWTPGYFSVAPSVQVDSEGVAGNSARRTDIFNVPTISGFSYRSSDSTNNVAVNQNVTLQVTRQGSDYQENFALSAVPIQKVCYIKDVKASGAHGGSSAANTWETRNLNTIEGDSSIVSILSDQMTIQPGLYKISAVSPCSGTTNEGRIALYNITTPNYDILGMSAYASSSGNGTAHRRVEGILEITVPTIFEIRQRSTTAQVNIGFGHATSIAGQNEIYTTVELVKLR